MQDVQTKQFIVLDTTYYNEYGNPTKLCWYNRDDGYYQIDFQYDSLNRIVYEYSHSDKFSIQSIYKYNSDGKMSETTQKRKNKNVEDPVFRVEYTFSNDTVYLHFFENNIRSEFYSYLAYEVLIKGKPKMNPISWLKPFLENDTIYDEHDSVGNWTKATLYTYDDTTKPSSKIKRELLYY